MLSQTITVPTEVRNNTTYNGFTATQNYTYDSLNRIHYASETIASTQQWKQTFSYDRFGNRTFDEANTTTLPKNCGSNPSLTVCTADRKIYNPTPNTSDNRLSSNDGYSFDLSGNTIRDAQSRKFTYDAENKQTKVETVDSSGNPISTIGEYSYDGDGKRVKKYVPSTGETTIFVYDASGKMVAEYSTQLATTPQVSYLTSDHLGSPRINTDANGAVTARHDYQPFGEEITRASYGADTNRKQFTGYERDNETNLDYAKARMFGSGFGRFTSPDPVMESAKKVAPQSWNRYSYVLNNPLKLIDPSGKTWVWSKDVDKNGNHTYGWATGKTPKGFEKIPMKDGVFHGTAYRNGKAVGDLTLYANKSKQVVTPFPKANSNKQQQQQQQEQKSNASSAPPTVPAMTGSVQTPSNLHLWNSIFGNNTNDRLQDLLDHFGDHGHQFGAKDAEDYCQQSRDFLKDSQDPNNYNYETKVDEFGDGAIRVYDSETNTFGAYNSDTTTRTFMKPDRETYFDDQPGFAPEDPIIFDDVLIDPIFIP